MTLLSRRLDSPPLPALRKKAGSSDAGSSIEGRSLSSASVGGLSSTDDEQVESLLQCGQIGQFLKVIGDMISIKSSPNAW